MDLNLKSVILSSVKANEEFMESSRSDALDPLWIIFGEAVIALKECVTQVANADDDKDHTLMLMCCNALSDSFSAFLSVRQGFLRPPAIVLRGVVENLAAVVAFHEDDEAFENFKTGRYDIQKAITPSKKHFPELATQYGILTNSFTHETYASVGRSLGEDKGIYLVPNLSEVKLGSPHNLLITAIAMIAHSVGQISEFCLIRYLSNPFFWEKVCSEHIKMKTTEGRKLISVLSKQLEESLTQRSGESY